jgi:hypothetical protein
MSVMLDQQLLNELEGRWRSQGALVADYLAPGLSDDEMQALVTPLGLRLPREARLWWGWHNGTVADAPNLAWDIGPSRAFFSLELAVEESLGGREDLEGCGWQAGWIQVTSDRSRIYIDCSGDDNEPVSVWAVDWELDNPVAPTLGSFGDLVSTWITAIDLGAWKWNADRNGWDWDRDKLTPEIQRLGVT